MTEAASLAAALRAATARLRTAGLPGADLDARLLLGHVLGEPRLSLALHGERPLALEQAVGFERLIARRLAGEPVARILGHREFWGIEFALSADTLVPRPDSETLVEAALDRLGDRSRAPFRIADLGTGSGCLLVALLAECPLATGLGTDLSPVALRAARANAEAAGVGARAVWLAANWAAPLAARFDLVLSNPPYIATADIAGLERDVREHDPARALDGGDDGLDAYRALAQALPRLLAPEGLAVVELGAGQRAEVERLMRAAGLAPAGCRRDLGGVERALLLTMPGS